MISETPDLGKIKSVHGISNVYTQRLVIVAGLALIFFSSMLIAFAVRQWFGYAFLAVAFLAVEILTLVGWFSNRAFEFAIYEKGFIYKGEICYWNEIESLFTTEDPGLMGSKMRCEIRKVDGGLVVVPDLIQGFHDVIKTIGRKMEKVEVAA
jgi:hypothetical protein